MPAAAATSAAEKQARTSVPRLSMGLLQTGDLPGRAGELEDVQAGVGAIDDVDVAPRIRLDVVGLDRGLAAVLARDADAARVGLVGDRRDEIADLGRMIRVPHVEGAHAGIEEGDEGHLPVVDGIHALVRGMRAEAAAALAEVPAGLR